MKTATIDLPSQDIVNASKEEMRFLLHEAWLIGLFSAENGNASLRLPAPWHAFSVITAAGTSKGHLDSEDLSLMLLPEGTLCTGKSLSSETGVHISIYTQTSCCAVLHTHPPHLMALEVRLGGKTQERNTSLRTKCSQLPLYEARMWSEYLGQVQAYPPGSQELASAVAYSVRSMCSQNAKLRSKGALWMAEHGLCTWGSTIKEAMSLSEEFEHLALIALHAMPC